ncbi:MAG TPA: FISUMP domain-containing protein [bacterium]|nr:FISUMP domain-containing protein [bacterium]
MKNKNGFTLIELLITVFIIAIILTIATISFSEIRKNSRDNQRVQDIQQMQLVLEKYYQENNSYPNEIIFGGSLTNEEEEKIYLSKIPQNPSPRSDESCPESEYIYEINNNNYSIEFCLGKETGKVSAGYNCATPQGIRSGKCFQCGVSVSYDGQDYATIQIGNQCWFKENLNVGIAKLNNESLSSSSPEKYCHGATNYETDPSNNCSIYGGLYTWESLMQGGSEESAQGLCPSGWHIPTIDELMELIDGFGGLSIAGEGLKASSTDPVPWDGNNNSGFTALPSGGRNTFGAFFGLSSNTTWSSTPLDSSSSNVINLNSEINDINKYSLLNDFAFSARCIKN